MWIGFAKASGTVTGEIGKKWPIADRRVPSKRFHKPSRNWIWITGYISTPVPISLRKWRMLVIAFQINNNNKIERKKKLNKVSQNKVLVKKKSHDASILGLQHDKAPMLFINTVEPRYNKVLGTRNNFPYLRLIIRYMKKNLDITKSRYSERILTIRSPLYYGQFFWPGKTAIHFRVSF